ncbi:hypothetical protein [Spirosoma endbachense]|uniref:TonB C-terminal domain-containing protein n=1 Tax=Spirosoma endbachense TaxID=2666025 RepID=A0A6P1VNH0_9BACT|nr:hypothetical protein [Spirosoma endbachense]QHV93530.1 hypothetical protein GJR95_00095 [Spirosoma endbachense]
MKKKMTFILLLIFWSKSFSVAGQGNFDKRVLKGSIESYSVSISGTDIIVKNQKNKLTRTTPNYNIEKVSTSGIDANKVYTDIMDNLRTALSSKQKSLFKAGKNILVSFEINNQGKIEEPVFFLSKDSPLTIAEIENIEKIIKKTRMNFKNPDQYSSINFIPWNIVLRSKDL